MIDWLRRLGRHPQEPPLPKQPPLQGVPAIRRTKTYSALSGYVFQYVYAGYRQQRADAAAADNLPAKDYVFLVRSQRESECELPIRLPEAIPATLAEQAGRPLSARECYALAKLKLFRVLDEWRVREGPESPRALLRLPLAPSPWKRPWSSGRSLTCKVGLTCNICLGAPSFWWWRARGLGSPGPAISPESVRVVLLFAASQ